MLVLLFALCRLGAIFQPLNFRLSPAEHARQLLDSTPRLLLHQAAVQRTTCSHGGAKAALPDAAWRRRRVLGRRSDRQPRCADERVPSSRPGRLEDDALLVYTSGTSGEPKGVLLTQNALLFNCINSIHAHDLTQPTTA